VAARRGGGASLFLVDSGQYGFSKQHSSLMK